MTGKWASSNRRAELPANWPAIRRAVIRRARGQCEWVGPPIIDNAALPDNHPATIRDHPRPSVDHRCTNRGTDVDHRNDPTDHNVQALQLLCPTHHKLKTQSEARAAAQAQRDKLTHPAARRAHPGLID